MSASYSTLIGALELAQRLHDPDWIVFDCRFDLTDPAFGRQAYAGGHVPGAFFLDLDDDLSGAKTGSNGRHPLPDPAWLAARLAACGVGNHTQVIAYDDASGMFAARLWWLLRWFGHRRVAVLDVFRSGDEVLLVEMDGRIKSLKKGHHQTQTGAKDEPDHQDDRK